MNQQKLKLKSLAGYNPTGMNSHKVALRAGVSYPTAVKYMENRAEEPGILFVAKILNGLGVDWRSVTLGELVEGEAE